VILAALLAANAIHAGETPLGQKDPGPEAPTTAKAADESPRYGAAGFYPSDARPVG
jgi:hypothetical protein